MSLFFDNESKEEQRLKELKRQLDLTVEKRNKIVSQQYKVKLLPFFLDGVAGNKTLIQNDQIHPNAKAQPIMLNLAYPYIKGAL